ncbi:MAG: hypothetical protein ACK5A0_11020, partial [Polaromonas sp.]
MAQHAAKLYRRPAAKLKEARQAEYRHSHKTVSTGYLGTRFSRRQVVTVYLLGVSNQGLSDIPEVKKPLNPLRIKGFHIGGWGGI